MTEYPLVLEESACLLSPDLELSGQAVNER